MIRERGDARRNSAGDARRAEAAGATLAGGQRSHLAREGLGDRRDDELRDPVAAPDRERRLPVIDQDHLDLAAIVAVDGTGRVQDRDAMPGGEPGAGPHLRLVALGKMEAKPGGEQDDAVPKPKNLWQLPQAMMKQTKETLHFLRQTPLACLYMLAASGLGGFITLTGFFVQQHLVEHGAGGTALLGPILFGISLGGVAGAKLAIPLAKLRHRNAVLICGILSAAGVALCSSPLPAVCVAGGFFMMICDEALCTLTDARLNQLFPSAQRATLVSVFSMSFSLVMVVLSPLVGAWCGLWGTGVAFALCAGVMLAATLAGRLWVGYLLK